MEKVERISMMNVLSNSGLPGITQYQDNIIIVDIRPEYFQKLQLEYLPIKFEDYCILLVEKGEIQINVDYIPCFIKQNTFLLIKERNITQIITVSDNFRGYWIIVASRFLRSLTKDVSSPHGVNTTLLNPVTQLEHTEFEVLRNNMERLRINIHRSKHLFYSKLVQNELTNLILELWNFRVMKPEINATMAQKTGNRENVVAEFIKLLFVNIRKEREVAFYADLLCVTPIYLSRAVKHVIGLPPIRIINDLVISDAIILLRQKNMTIQQIAEELNFPDQASFSKFFKKNTGKPPMEYRRKMIEK